MQKFEPLTYGNFFHIYNRGINSCNIFAENENYEYFLDLYDKKISPVADTYAWALMKNHFHFLVKIKEEREYLSLFTYRTLTGLRAPSGLERLRNNFPNFLIRMPRL